MMGDMITFLGTIMTLTVLCFFTTRNSYSNKNTEEHELLSDSNFMYNLLHLFVKRVFALMNEEGEKIIKTIEDESSQIKILLNAIASSQEEKNPYKQKMLILANEIQMLTLDYQTKYLSLCDDVKNLNNIIIKSPTEFLSAFFYTFLFCVFVLSIECLFPSYEWLTDVLGFVTVTSFLYWVLIWCNYCISLKKRKVDTPIIVYEFKIISIFRFLIGVVVSIFLFWCLNDVNIIVCYICICMLGGGYLLFDKVKKKEYCIFTYYFCLIHFILVIMFFLMCCSVYHFILENQPLFNNSLVLKWSLIFAIFNGLLLPLLVPSFRLIWEVFRVKIKFKKDTKRYQKESVQKTIELNKYFQFLIQLRSL